MLYAAPADDLAAFVYDGRPTERTSTDLEDPQGGTLSVPTFINEFWTSKQRAAHSLHEVSYRACFKPQLPRFFIERLTRPGDRVYDPFMGRGTTLLESALLGRTPVGCDVNPLSRVLVEGRLAPPSAEAVADRLAAVELSADTADDDPLLVFYHPSTLAQIRALRTYLLDRATAGTVDEVDRWIRMVAVNRLTGHSPGFFSVYTLPPNQAVSVDGQRKINAKRGQAPPPRDVRALILRKTRALLADCDGASRVALRASAPGAQLLTATAEWTPEIPDGSIDLVVTSPPFLDVVDYAGDNWLRGWFCGIDPTTVSITIARRIDDWCEAMTRVFAELRRVVRVGGYVAFEVGEVRGGSIQLERFVIPAASRAGLVPELVLINAQDFTKTANCWGVSNNAKGTNTNRVVLLRRP